MIDLHPEISPAHARLDEVIGRSQQWFLREQFEDGYWWAELESNATMDAEYILVTHFLGQRDEAIWRGIAQDIRNYQRADGSWALYDGAPGDLSTTIESYFALRLAGDRGPHLDRARQFILDRGGIARARVFTRIWLALCGEWSWDDLPTMPLELMLLPPRAPISIYRFASWARATIVPLLVLMTDRPVHPVPASASLADIRGAGPIALEPRDFSDRSSSGSTASCAGISGCRGTRCARAKKAAELWLLSHQEADGSWGGIQPPWVYSLMALDTLGYGPAHPAIRRGIDGMHDRWMIRRTDGSLRIQACLSPVWDTALSLVALSSRACPRGSAVQKAARWVLKEEVRVPGDWCVWVPGVEPSGWSFEFENDIYPDVDDTAVVLLGLHKAGVLDETTRRRALTWLLAMQCENGGWAAFDKDNTSRLPARIPFADFGEMIDPPSADVTAHVVELLGVLGFDRGHPALARALEFLRRSRIPTARGSGAGA